MKKERLANGPWTARIDKLTAKVPIGVAVGVDGQVIYEHRAGAPRTPASNQKLVMTMALFDVLGAGFRIPSFAAARHTRGGKVKGDLWVMGRGDPTLTDNQEGYWGSSLEATTLSELARRIKSAGVETVTGRVMGATDYFSHDFDPPGWQPYVPYQYVQLPTSLSLNGNFSGKARREQAVATTLTRELKKRGVSVRGKAGSGTPPPGLDEIATVRSAPLARIASYMNQSSNNFFAEMLGKLLGARRYGAPGSIHTGARAIEWWARREGLQVTAFDSSGLSYKNSISPGTMVKLLGVAQDRPWFEALRSGLPSAGQGTLAYRLDGVKVRAKTGTLFNDDSALSGWVKSKLRSGWIEFSIFDSGSRKKLEDHIVKVLAQANIKIESVPKEDLSCDRPK